jgi:hypothetical protein
MITQNRLKELIDYDSESGVFTRKTSYNRYKKGEKIGFKNTGGYIEAGVDKKYYGLHRLAWLYVHGVLPEIIDHINGDKTDNRIINLRSANRKINSENLVKPRKDNASGYLGVNFHKASKKWVAQISVNKKKKHLGCFDSPEKARDVYLLAKRNLHEGCTI